jgi:hypothetical protein
VLIQQLQDAGADLAELLLHLQSSQEYILRQADAPSTYAAARTWPGTGGNCLGSRS